MNARSTALLCCSAFLFLSASCVAQHLPRVTSFLDSCAGDLGFSGVVLIAQDDSILLHRGYGHSDRSKRIPTDKNTVYNIASITKAFTAVAVTKLAEDGKLQLSEPVSNFFPDAPPDKRDITVHQLLVHASGFPQGYAAEGHSSATAALKALWKVPLDSASVSYSNNNYSLLALIIEKVTAMNWEDHITEAILHPLAMNSTHFWRDTDLPNLHAAEPIGKKVKRQRDYGFLGSTGIFTNAVDMLKFQNVLKGSAILNDSSRAIVMGRYGSLRSSFLNSTDHFSYGMFQTYGDFNSIWFRGNESDWGTTIAYWFPSSNTSIIVLSNQRELSNGQRPHIFISAGIIKIMDAELRE